MCAARDDYRATVRLGLRFPGIDSMTAMTVLAELADITHFGSASQLMPYGGLLMARFSQPTPATANREQSAPLLPGTLPLQAVTS